MGIGILPYRGLQMPLVKERLDWGGGFSVLGKLDEQYPLCYNGFVQTLILLFDV